MFTWVYLKVNQEFTFPLRRKLVLVLLMACYLALALTSMIKNNEVVFIYFFNVFIYF